MTTEERTRVWLVAIAGLGVVVAVAVPLLFWGHLPEPVATHWSLSGVPNGKMSRAASLAVFLAIVAVPTALSWPRPGKAVSEPARLIGGIGFLSCLVALVSATTVHANFDRADWREAHLSIGWVLAALVGSGLVGSGLALLARRWVANAGSGRGLAAPLELGSDERVFWANGASNAWLLGVTGVAFVMGVRLLVKGSPVNGGVLLFAAGLSELFSRIRVTVNGRFVTVQYGHLGWFRQRIQLNRIVSATSAELVPMAHGGWGYRGSLSLFRRAAVVVRRGVALQLELAENRRFSVTVDDAATAAQLLSGLLQREGRLAP